LRIYPLKGGHLFKLSEEDTSNAQKAVIEALNYQFDYLENIDLNE